MCNSFDDALKAGRVKKENLDKKALEGLMLKKLEHYSTRYNEHLRSLKFAIKR